MMSRSIDWRPRRATALFASLILALALLLSLAALRSGPASAAPSSQTALDWYDITDRTVTAAAFPEPVTQSRTWAVSWLAAARAVGSSRDSSFATAALAQALHDTLVAQVPSQQSQLDADLASTLGSIPDGPAKQAGIQAGKHQAVRVLSQREGDGLDSGSVDAPWSPPPPAPGVWQPTPPTFGPAIRAGQGKARAFLLRSNDQFRPGPPPALDSSTYLKALAEVRAVGKDTSSVRTAAQTDVARFWEPATNVQYVQLLRQALDQNATRPLSWDTRFVAAFNVITVDAQIAIYEAKFKYVFWRPVTAIRTGSVDPDPSWTPFFDTPRHPEYPSGHAGYGGAAQEVLAAFDGSRPAEPVSATSPSDPGSTHTWTSWSQITREIVNARVWEGVHFRFSDNIAARVGAEVADYDLRHLASLGI